MLPDYAHDLLVRLETRLEAEDRVPFRQAAAAALMALPPAMLALASSIAPSKAYGPSSSVLLTPRLDLTTISAGGNRGGTRAQGQSRGEAENSRSRGALVQHLAEGIDQEPATIALKKHGDDGAESGGPPNDRSRPFRRTSP